MERKRDAETAFGKSTGKDGEKLKRRHGKRSKSEKNAPHLTKTHNPTPSIQNNIVNGNGRATKSEKIQSDKTSKKKKTKADSGRLPSGADETATVQQTQRQRRSPGWSLSQPEGGRFQRLDPLLLDRDRYLLIAVRTQLQLYLTATSSLVRSLRTGDSGNISSYSISPQDQKTILISTSSGAVLKWNWMDGTVVQNWTLKGHPLYASEISPRSDQEETRAIVLLEGVKGSARKLVLASWDGASSEASETPILLERENLSSAIKILDQAKHLVLFADNKIIIGQGIEDKKSKQAGYRWREIDIPTRIVSMDARSRPGHGKKSPAAIDVAVGCSDGSIVIYDDLLARLTRSEKSQDEPEILGRRFVWHRKEVLAVKWSVDGNYIVSGSHETVMVIWQLDTGDRQYLPHLSATITNITVATSGSVYAVQLANNSAIVLSTSELQPIASISGLAVQEPRLVARGIKTVPVAVHPNNKSIIALAVPTETTSSSSLDRGATLLQTFNFKTQVQSGKQALARNNITEIGVDPVGQDVREPEVVLMKISSDGKWLATIDEWAPSDDDMRLMCPVPSDEHFQIESFLKFWSYQDTTKTWQLVTKVKSSASKPPPHHDLLNLVSHPHRAEFATLSSDHVVKIWNPKVRFRQGVPAKNSSGSLLSVWECKNAIRIQEVLSLPPTSKTLVGSLCYSSDGSALACASNASPLITLLDPFNGRVVQTQRGSKPGQFSHLAFLNHHLISIGRDLRVHNSVNGDLLSALALTKRPSQVLLAANEHDGSFAIVLKISSKNSAGDPMIKSHVMVSDLTRAYPLFIKIIPGAVEVLLSLPGESGYLMINDQAEAVYLLQSDAGPDGALKSIETLSQAREEMRTGLEDLFGRRAVPDHSITGPDDQQAGTEEEAAVREKTNWEMSEKRDRSSLQAIFESAANLSVRELFQRVADVHLRSAGTDIAGTEIGE